MRTRTLLTLLALGLFPALPAAAQPVDEIGFAVWHTVPVFSGFGFRESLSLTADARLTPVWLRLRPGLRVSSAAAIEGSALGQPSVQLLGSFHEISPSLSVLAGRDVGPARIQGGIGLAYHLRFTLTQDAAVAQPIVPISSPAFGTVRSLGLTHDPGLDVSVEAAFWVPLGFRVVLGGGASFAGARLLAQTREDPDVEVSLPQRFFTWNIQLGLRWTSKIGQQPAPPGEPR